MSCSSSFMLLWQSHADKLKSYRFAIETIIITGIGTLMHLCHISMIELRYTKLPMLMPNPASILFVFSILLMLCKLRPFQALNSFHVKRCFSFIIELAMILYANDFILRQIWLPSLKLLDYLCQIMADYAATIDFSTFWYNGPKVGNWIRDDGFYMIRFIFAVITFISMLDVTKAMMKFIMAIRTKNIMSFFQSELPLTEEEIFMVETLLQDDDELNVNEIEQSVLGRLVSCNNFDAKELPYVPHDDNANLDCHGRRNVRRNGNRNSYRSSSRQSKRSSSRQSKRSSSRQSKRASSRQSKRGSSRTKRYRNNNNNNNISRRELHLDYSTNEYNC